MQKKKKSILKKNSIGEKRKSSDVGHDKVAEETSNLETIKVDDQQQIENHEDEQKIDAVNTEPNSNENEQQQQNGNDVVEVKPEKQPDEKTAMEIINDILNPPMPEFDPSKPYNVPTAVKAGDINALQELDERKIIELKEVCYIQ